MADYYVNNRAQDSGDHEVHVNGCRFMPVNRTYLGSFTHCAPAVREAKKIYPTADGCATCCPECHTR